MINELIKKEKENSLEKINLLLNSSSSKLAKDILIKKELEFINFNFDFLKLIPEQKRISALLTLKNSKFIFYDEFKKYLDVCSIKNSLKNNILFFDNLRLDLKKMLDSISNAEKSFLLELNYSKQKYILRKIL